MLAVVRCISIFCRILRLLSNNHDHSPMNNPSFRFRLIASFLFCAVTLAGCKDTAKKNLGKTEQAVDTALDCWARGEPASKFADPSQPIQLDDPDWKAGMRLLSFLNSGTTAGSDPNHFRCKVALSLQGPDGKQVQKDVVYDVQVGDKIIIVRSTQE